MRNPKVNLKDEFVIFLEGTKARCEVQLQTYRECPQRYPFASEELYKNDAIAVAYGVVTFLTNIIGYDEVHSEYEQFKHTIREM